MSIDIFRKFEESPGILSHILKHLDVDTIAKFKWIMSKDDYLKQPFSEALILFLKELKFEGSVLTLTIRSFRDAKKAEFLLYNGGGNYFVVKYDIFDDDMVNYLSLNFESSGPGRIKTFMEVLKKFPNFCKVSQNYFYVRSFELKRAQRERALSHS